MDPRARTHASAGRAVLEQAGPGRPAAASRTGSESPPRHPPLSLAAAGFARWCVSAIGALRGGPHRSPAWRVALRAAAVCGVASLCISLCASWCGTLSASTCLLGVSRLHTSVANRSVLHATDGRISSCFAGCHGYAWHATPCAARCEESNGSAEPHGDAFRFALKIHSRVNFLQ